MERVQAQLPAENMTEAGVMPAHLPYLPADITGSQEGLRVSEAEYWATWYHDPDYSYEWNNGILEVKPVGDYHGFLMSQWFIFLLNEFLKAHPIARAVGMDIGFRLAFSNHVSIRKPDYAVIRNDNPASIELRDASYRGLYDLCVEFLSYSSPAASRRDTVQKKQEYAGAGVQEYYILDPRGLQTAFYSLDRDQRYRPIEPVSADVIQSAVLPGFQLRASDLYRRPDFESLTQDATYRHYVLLKYQEQTQRAEQAENMLVQATQRAEREKQKAEREKQRARRERERAEKSENLLVRETQRAEKLAARLRELGISLDENDATGTFTVKMNN